MCDPSVSTNAQNFKLLFQLEAEKIFLKYQKLNLRDMTFKEKSNFSVQSSTISWIVTVLIHFFL